MYLLTILFACMCAVLAIIVAVLDSKRANLLSEKGREEGHIESLNQALYYLQASTSPEAFLTSEDITKAIREAGYDAKSVDGWIRFSVQEINYFVETKHPPLVVIARSFCLRESEWDPDIIREAARKVTEEKNMPKLVIDEAIDENHLFHGHIFIAAMDRNVRSFRANLKVYMELLDEGLDRMTAYYNNQQERMDTSTVAVKSFLAQQAEDKVFS